MEFLLLFQSSILYLINQFVENLMVALFGRVKNLSNLVLSVGVDLKP